MSKKRTAVSRVKLARLLARDGNKCHYCGVTVYPSIDFTPCYLTDGKPLQYARIKRYIPNVVVECYESYDPNNEEYRGFHLLEYPASCNIATADHVVPVSKGGTNDLSNLVIACLPCNSQKSACYDYDEFKRMKLEGCAE